MFALNLNFFMMYANILDFHKNPKETADSGLMSVVHFEPVTLGISFILIFLSPDLCNLCALLITDISRSLHALH